MKVCTLGLREHRGNRLGKTGQTVDRGDQGVGDASGLQLVQDLEPELGTLEREYLERHRFRSQAEARMAAFELIEG